MEIKDTKFYENKAFSGGVFVLDNSAQVNITNLTMTNNSVISFGGVF